MSGSRSTLCLVWPQELGPPFLSERDVREHVVQSIHQGADVETVNPKSRSRRNAAVHNMPSRWSMWHTNRRQRGSLRQNGGGNWLWSANRQKEKLISHKLRASYVGWACSRPSARQQRNNFILHKLEILHVCWRKKVPKDWPHFAKVDDFWQLRARTLVRALQREFNHLPGCTRFPQFSLKNASSEKGSSHTRSKRRNTVSCECVSK